MANNIYNRMSPAGQFAGMVGTSLSQVLGGFLGAKLEQDRMRRQFDTNRRILKARHPKMSEEELSEYAQVPTENLQQVMGGISQRGLSDVMAAGAQQQLPEDIMQQEQLQQQDMMGAMQEDGAEIMQGIQDLDNVPAGSPLERRVIREANMEAAKIQDMENALATTNLDRNEYEAARKHIDDRRKALEDRLMDREKIAMKQQEARRRQANEDRKFDLDRQKFLQSIGLEKAKQEERRQGRLDKKYDEYYNDLLDKEILLEEDLVTLKMMKKLNSDPKSDFGYQGFNMLAKGYAAKVLGDPTAYMALDAQTFEKLTANLITRKIQQMKGVGRVTNKMVEQIEKQVPSLMQSPEGRQRVINMLLDQSKLERAEIKAARKVKKKNKGYTDNFREQINKAMKPQYRKFKTRVLNVVNKAAKKAAPQQRQFEGYGISEAATGAVSDFWRTNLGMKGPQRGGPPASPAAPVVTSGLGTLTKSTINKLLGGFRAPGGVAETGAQALMRFGGASLGDRLRTR